MQAHIGRNEAGSRTCMNIGVLLHVRLLTKALLAKGTLVPEKNDAIGSTWSALVSRSPKSLGYIEQHGASQGLSYRIMTS